eukprot:1662702-Pleurochrysis_carterae.AAC.2
MQDLPSCIPHSIAGFSEDAENEREQLLSRERAADRERLLKIFDIERRQSLCSCPLLPYSFCPLLCNLSLLPVCFCALFRAPDLRHASRCLRHMSVNRICDICALVLARSNAQKSMMKMAAEHELALAKEMARLGLRDDCRLLTVCRSEVQGNTEDHCGSGSIVSSSEPMLTVHRFTQIINRAYPLLSNRSSETSIKSCLRLPNISHRRTCILYSRAALMYSTEPY